MGDVGDVAVLYHVVGDGAPAQVDDQLQEQEAPVHFLEEDIVEAV